MSDFLCPNDGLPMRRDTRPITLNYRDQSITLDMAGWYCDCCGEGVFSGKEMRLTDRALYRMKARHEGLLEPEDIRRIRKKLHLTQNEAGQMIGGGPRAFQKYEKGDLLPSRALSSVLMLLDHDPKALAILKNRQAKSFAAGHDARV